MKSSFANKLEVGNISDVPVRVFRIGLGNRFDTPSLVEENATSPF